MRHSPSSGQPCDTASERHGDVQRRLELLESTIALQRQLGERAQALAEVRELQALEIDMLETCRDLLLLARDKARFGPNGVVLSARDQRNVERPLAEAQALNTRKRAVASRIGVYLGQ